SASSSRTSLPTATTSALFETPLPSGAVGGAAGAGTSASPMHSPHHTLPPAHHSPAMASQVMKAPDQQLNIATEMTERRADDQPSSSSRSMPATTPISVIVEGGEEDEEGKIRCEDGGTTRNEVVIPSSSLLSIAEEVVVEEDDDDEGKLMIDEGDEESREGAESATAAADAALTAPSVHVQPPTPVGEKRMELMQMEGDEDERDSATRDSDPIDEGTEESMKEASSSLAYSEDVSTPGTSKKRKRTGDKPGRKAEKGANKRTSGGLAGSSWAKNRRSAEPELSSAAAAAAAVMADDPYAFHDDSSPDSRLSRGVTMDRELSAPPAPKRQRISRTQSPTPSNDVDMEEYEDEESRQSMGSKKVPPLRLVLPPKPSDDGDGGDEGTASSSHTPIPTSQPRKPGRGRPAGRKTGDEEGSAQRMTRSKVKRVRQSGRGLDENEGGGKRKRGRQSLAAVMEEETAGEEGEGDYSSVATPVMGGVGEGSDLLGTYLSLSSAASAVPNPDAALENEIYEITTQSTLMARANLDQLVDRHIGGLYKADREAPQWQPSDVQLRTFLTFNNHYTLAERPAPPGGWPPMVSAQEVAAAAAGVEVKEQQPSGSGLQQGGNAADAAAAPSTSTENVGEKKVVKNRFETIDERMKSLWDELERERKHEAIDMEGERVRLRISLERQVIIREKTIKGHLNQLTFCKYLQLKETCNPHSLLDKQKPPNVERDITRFVEHLESRAEELWKRHRFVVNNSVGRQVAKWRDEMNKHGFRDKTINKQCRAFPEMVAFRVPIPPIYDYVLPVENAEEEAAPVPK
ncbi:hypothetical protein PMAYCL1PPCAC_23269, partial [Pristionchus mayeri]